MKQKIIMLVIAMYFTLVPAGIVLYGISHNITGFDHRLPYSEIYSVLGMAWLFGHMFLIPSIYIFYLCVCNVYKRINNKTP